MRYSVDLRLRVLAFVSGGGSKVEAARVFAVSRAVIYQWLALGSAFVPGKPGPKKGRKLDALQLEAAVRAHPDWLLKEHALAFGVSVSAIGKALARQGIARKKKIALRGKREA